MKYYVYWIHLPGQKIKTEGYVGITKNPSERWADHKYQSRINQHRNNYFQNAILKYADKLIHEIIFEGSLEGCSQLEYYFRPKEKIGWNIAIGGEIAGMLGRSHSDETKALLSKSAKERNSAKYLHTKEVWSKISNAMKGGKNHQASAVICIDTGEIFETCTAAGKAYGVSHSAISACCRLKKPKIKNKVFRYVKDIDVYTYKSSSTE